MLRSTAFLNQDKPIQLASEEVDLLNESDLASVLFRLNEVILGASQKP